MGDVAASSIAMTQVIAIASGKGGVGKTTVAVNLATALANRGHRVMLLDGDLGMADVDVALGLHPAYDLSDVLRGDVRLEDIIIDGPSGVAVVPAMPAGSPLAELSSLESAGLIAAFNTLRRVPDVLIVDTAAGMGSNGLRLIQAANEVLMVVDDQPTTLQDARNLICRLHEIAGTKRFRVLTNRIDNEIRGWQVCDHLMRLLPPTAGVCLHFVGTLPDDPVVSVALQQAQPVVNADPDSLGAHAFKNLARRIEAWAPPGEYTGGMAFFVERLIRRNTPQQKMVM